MYLRSYPISTIVRLSGKLAMVEFYHLAYVRQVTTYLGQVVAPSGQQMGLMGLMG